MMTTECAYSVQEYEELCVQQITSALLFILLMECVLNLSLS